MAKLPEHMPLQVEKLFYDLQNRIMIDIVRRIQKMGKITSTADYQINKLQILGGTTEFIESEIKRITGMTDAEIWKIYDEVVEEYYTRNKAAYEQINSNFIPYEENEILQAWTAAIVDQTQNEIRNIARSMGMSIALGGGKKVFTPLAEYYQSYLDRACMDIVTGSFSYNTVLRRVVKEMTASGIRSVDYASGWSNRVTVAARRAVMTGVHQLSAKINEKVAKDLGTKDYEITWHAGARPDHWWGGKVYSYEDLVRICGLGTVTGLCGANCYHSYYAFVKGISVRTYTDEQLADMNAREQEVHTYHGKPYNAYEATQRQRQLESRMRAQRSKVKLLQQGKADPDDIMAARTRYLATLHEYQGFSKVMKLPEQMERVYMDGLGRVTFGKITKKSIASGMKSGTIKLEEYYKGMPKTWKKLVAKDDSLKSVNPHYSPMKREYKENCTNCVSAYEMRKRGYDVIAKAAGKNHHLQRYPEDAWKNPQIIRTFGSGLDEILKTFENWPDNARAEIAVVWKYSREGHVFVGEKSNGAVAFYDVQSGVKYSENVFEKVTDGKTKFWRIDNLEPSDRGITACEGLK